MHSTKFLVLCLLGYFLTAKSIAQEFPFWGSLPKGKYKVGYRDTVIFNKDEVYTYYDYSEKKPFFIGIWYPAIDNSSKEYLTFGDYLNYSASKEISFISDSLLHKYKRVLIRNGVCFDATTGNTVEYDLNHHELFKAILTTRVRSKRNLAITSGRHPAIFYHHGAQGLASDNTTFCEFMASNGYIVISSNYQWPVEGEILMDTKKFMVDISFVLKQFINTKEIDPDEVFAVGHSWGAQAWLLYDTIRHKTIKKIFALHTTLENRDVEKAKWMSRPLLEVFEHNSESMTTPTVLFAPIQKNGPDYLKDGPEYLPFKQNKTTPYLFVTLNWRKITHEGFISFGSLKAPYANKFNLADRDLLKQQQDYYERVIILIRSLMGKSCNDIKDCLLKDVPDLRSHFDLSTYNVK